MNILKIFLYLSIISFFIGCGDNKLTTSDIKLTTDYISKDYNQTLPKQNIKIDINQQKAKIRKELSEYNVKLYLSTDKQNIFVLATIGYYTDLYHYDISQIDPVQVNIVRNSLSEKSTAFVYLYPLKNGKLMYILNVYETIEIHMYDIANLENIGYLEFEVYSDAPSFRFFSKLYESASAVIFDSEEKSFTIGDGIKIDISDPYNIKEVRENLE